MDDKTAQPGPGHRRMPRDVGARRRLQRAQQLEATAVSAVYRAEGALCRVQARHEAAIAASASDLRCAAAAVRDAQRILVKISGLERAAQLLGTGRAELRRSMAAARPEARPAAHAE